MSRIAWRSILCVLALVGAMGGCSSPSREWPLDRVRDALAPPGQREIHAVAASWNGEAPDSSNAMLIERGALELEHVTYDVRVFEHHVAGDRHVTAILVPDGAEGGALPILVECPGVRWDYPLRDVRRGPFLAGVLGADAGNYILVEPCLRGHELRVLDQVHRAEGDRRDSYDGATDDAAAAISVALSHVPECDGERVLAMGLSRGGSVALLLGMRDDRVDAVVAMSAPVDWFELMANPDEDWAERVARAAATYESSAPDRAVQFYEWFLQDRRSHGLAEVRRRILASSPMYFVERLPAAQLHYGTKDESVGLMNGTAIRDAFALHGFGPPAHQVQIHPGAGHLLTESDAFQDAVKFLRAQARSIGAD